MFKNVFSFNGRIRRTEYGVSFIIYAICYFIIFILAYSNTPILFLGFIPLVWFLWAQGAKRCHDVGNSGWWQLIPFYALWLLFQDGKMGPNEYGEDPKDRLDPLEYVKQYSSYDPIPKSANTVEVAENGDSENDGPPY